MIDLILDLLGIRQRRPKRIVHPTITVTIEGKAYETENWSMSGFSLNKFKREVTVGETLKGQIGPLGYSRGGGFNASVVRKIENGGFGACWSNIDREIYSAMSGPGR